jgi:protein TonB
VNDPVDRLLVERQRTVDTGFGQGALTSLVAHLVLVGTAFAAPWIFPAAPPLKVADGFAVVLPRGGGGDPQAGGPPAPPAAELPPPQAQPEPPAPEPPKVLKPPKEEPKKGLPELDSKRKAARKPEKPEARAAGKPSDAKGKAAAGAAKTGPGTASGTPGLAIGPPGPGVPDGTDTGGDWYLAGVQQKIWMIWTQQIKSGFTEPIGVTFTILADGSVADVQVTKPSQATLLNLAAQRAVLSAAPFGPLPKEYGTNRYTIQAIFKPTP